MEGGGGGGPTGSADGSGPGAAGPPPGIGTPDGGGRPAAPQGPAGGAPAPVGAPSGPAAGGRAVGGAPAGAPGQGDALAETRNFILLGDLHLKQGRAKDAIDAYSRAAKSFDQISINTWNWDRDQMITGHDVYNRLAQAHLAAGNLDEARKTLEKALKIPSLPKGAMILGGEGGGVGAPVAQAGQAQVPLPPRLVITVSKRSLDQAGGGKISFDEFAKQATVERLNYPPPGTAGRPTGGMPGSGTTGSPDGPAGVGGPGGRPADRPGDTGSADGSGRP